MDRIRKIRRSQSIKNITLYAVWLQDANGNGTPDYEETSATVTLVWEDGQNQTVSVRRVSK